MKEKVLIFSGAGVSAESGLRTFRDMGGLWNEYAVEEVASPEGWAKNPELVLRFYNERRRAVISAQPNEAHRAIARLEEFFDVVVITQNIDDLHERAGSSKVIHLHGEIVRARSSVDPNLTCQLDGADLEIGDTCEKGSQLRPDVVWFGEEVRLMRAAEKYVANAERIITVGTSLTVHPAAGLLKKAKFSSEKYLVSVDEMHPPYGHRFLRGSATMVVPHIVNCWIAGRKP
ncbi:SIR2 family NAD-dependent protein deacylase [Herbaspirillum autotrophicum]|uniref:SIR2 family NAD-dependent protein deacylase n=1 Tax=Herbaspirillum autotrophicum TaxID=180195 RepID=UPI00067AA456|nr:NAD-dependent deacylase [Herbaspirillum autotrophicum]